MRAGPADSSVADARDATSPSPSSVAPTRPASSASVIRWWQRRACDCIGARRADCAARGRALLVGERLDDLVGDVDALAGEDHRVLRESGRTSRPRRSAGSPCSRAPGRSRSSSLRRRLRSSRNSRCIALQVARSGWRGRAPCCAARLPPSSRRPCRAAPAGRAPAWRASASRHRARRTPSRASAARAWRAPPRGTAARC